MAKQQTHEIIVKVTFDRAIGPKEAVAYFRDTVPLHFYCDRWEGQLGEFHIKAVKLPKAGAL